ncbi:methionine synthase [uncultured Methanobrevibacter sp.]|uniref:methionine synthase n=1 Tax=uncultured Methanobrevibacter sp. TaxID=253161 RepID=UPI002637BA12|nr:methionine synthase [uncultured Methanobrevibacter sp.]
MLSTVVGSFPAEIKSPTTTKDKLLKVFGVYDPFKQSIKQTVISQLDAGIDIISDGQVRGDMVSTFTNFIPGMKLESNNTVITSKIRQPTKEISINDLKYAKKVMVDYFNGNIPENKGIKGIITGPSTIVYSSRIEAFYKCKDDAILDLAKSLKYEVDAIEKKINPVYIQVDEPFLSTGLVDLKVASEAIDIIGEDLSVPLAMHVCGNLTDVFKDLIKFNVDILDCEFAGNNTNIKILEKNASLVKNKKIGFGCLDTSLNEVDDEDKTEELIAKGVEILGKNNIILDPDCGLRRASKDVAFGKLKLMNKIKDEYN